PGPLLLTRGMWLSEELVSFYIYDNETQKRLNIEEANKIAIDFFPGFLRQRFTLDSIQITLELYFIAQNEAVIKATVENNTNNTKTFTFGWEGWAYNLPTNIYKNEDGITINLNDNDEKIKLTLPFEDMWNVRLEDLKYTFQSINPVSLSVSGKTSTYVLTTHLLNKENNFKLIKKSSAIIERLISKNRIRWHGYINNIISKLKHNFQSNEYRRIAIKCLLTLVNNWRCNLKSLKYDGLFPSYAVSYFNGFWAWDSWKHAVALVLFAPDLAKQQILAMADKQNTLGMIPDVIYTDSTEDNWRNTKPPLANWAAYRVFDHTQDTSFIANLYKKLKLYHHWWYKYRDNNNNNLCEYGSTDGSLVAAKWESGMDDAVRFDSSQIIENNELAWSINQESVDLNSFLYTDKVFLSKLAGVLGKKPDSIKFHRESEKLKLQIQNLMYNPNVGYFFDLSMYDKKYVNILGPEGWIPLWSGVATSQQAHNVKNIICDSTHFATYIPFPTVAKSEKGFLSGYWRGPVWIDQAYFAIKGLENYGYYRNRDNFIKQLLNRLEGLKNSDKPIRENYHPLTGKGLKVNHFSWSAACILLLLCE
ncbi:trehalase family glycosidase, partial [Bacteroidota bacterium]